MLLIMVQITVVIIITNDSTNNNNVDDDVLKTQSLEGVFCHLSLRQFCLRTLLLNL